MALEITRAEGFINGGDDIFDVLEKHSQKTDRVELKNSIDATLRLLRKSQKTIQQQSERIEVLESERMNDELTGLMSHRAFTDSMERELARIYRAPEREGVYVAIALENLSAIQHQHGSLAGRKALQILASSLTQEARTMDIAGRTGENAFSMMLMDTNQDAVISRIQMLNFNLNKLSFEWKSAEVRLLVSLSIKGCHAHDSIESFLPSYSGDREDVLAS